jgi:hypothetical protein
MPWGLQVGLRIGAGSCPSARAARARLPSHRGVVRPVEGRSSLAFDRPTTQVFLREAQQAARRLGTDANYIWTAFGPTNVAIHQVNTAMELGDVQIALDIGPTLDTSGLPTERRVRHALEVARAYSARNRRDEGLAIVLDAEQMAPEQVRHHYISRQLVLTWMRQQRRTPSLELAGLAARLRLT